MKPFFNKRSILWLVGVAILVVGFLVLAVVLPARSPVKGGEGPSVDVPNMENVPSENAPKMTLDTE